MNEYEMLTNTPTVDALADFRLQAKQELEEKSARSKMSDAALAKLQAIKAQDKIQEIEDARFASILRLVNTDDESLRTLIERCNQSVKIERLDRHAAKLSWWIAAGFRLGWEIDSMTMLNFFSALADEEQTMSDSRFSSLWSLAAAAKLKESRQSRGLIESTPELRFCIAGSKCLRAVRRKGHQVTGNAEYCSPACRASAKARAKRAAAAVTTSLI